MKNSMTLFRLWMLIFFFCLSLQEAGAYSQRRFSSRNGLSSSSIVSIYQDHTGYMWFGTYDGLNTFDGLNIQIYKPAEGENNLSGNLIEKIIEGEENVFWILTNYGLDRFNRHTQSLRSYPEFQRGTQMTRGLNGELFLIREINYVEYNLPGEEDFHRLYVEELTSNRILDLFVDRNNILRIFTDDDRCVAFSLEWKEETLRLVPVDDFRHDRLLVRCFHDENAVYFIDDEYILYEYDPVANRKYYVYDLREECRQKGEVVSIIKLSNDNYVVAFKHRGLVQLTSIPDQKNKYMAESFEINSRIFTMVKDRLRDIIWIGTDGLGALMYFMDDYSLKHSPLTGFRKPVTNPVRALYYDEEQTLWVGTKGDGLLKLYEYDVRNNSYTRSEQLLVRETALHDNSVYSFGKSSRNLLWVGNEMGLNYHSYKENRLKSLPVTADGSPLRYVYSICEADESTLWIATVGEGIVRVELGGTKDLPVVTDTKRFVFEDGSVVHNCFFTSCRENDSILWFGNRGGGAYRLNMFTEEVRVFRLDEGNTTQAINDVYSIHINEKGYWFGTSYGLVHMQDGRKRFFNESNGFPNNTIHGILEDNRNNLWLSSNLGMVKFNMDQQTFQVYRQKDELEVIEFCDGAYYKDPVTGDLFLGGVNGFVTIMENDYMQQPYEPVIHFKELSIFGKRHNIYDFMYPGKGRNTLRLNYDQNFFALSFGVIDYINNNDYTYYYKLNELSEHWVDNGNSQTAGFTNISPGTYTLSVQYRNNITGRMSEVYTLPVEIRPPWYRTPAAYVVYFLLLLLGLYVAVQLTLKWYNLKKGAVIEKMNRQQREEVYESKLRFFTNITHELCTPITLIHGPCEKILAQTQQDKDIYKYASLIQHNADKLNGLIQELIEFRRLDTGNKSLEITSLLVSDLATNIASSFAELAESREISYQVQIEENVSWNSDSSGLSKIITNLLSNAFKYTFDRGEVKIELSRCGDKLQIAVSNTGKGIREENLSEIFDRYKILDDFESQSQAGRSPRNGLGLAICHNMVKLLKGDIRVESTPGEWTVFTVVLPLLEVTIQEAPDLTVQPDALIVPDIPVVFENRIQEHDKSRSTIMIVEDDNSMLWFLTELFSGKYNIVSVNDSTRVMQMLEVNQPNLIISDIVMPGVDGITLTRQIKSDKMLNHIPLILLSSKMDSKDQVRGIEAGAEFYITKPFNVDYLERVVDRLLQRKEELKTYYNSPLSSFELENGHFTHKEDREFYDRILRIVEENLLNPELSVEMLSAKMGLSSRQFYRKVKSVTDKTPNEIIREYRLRIVDRLLVTTNLSIDEIITQSGFMNKGYFFRTFTQKYGMTPRNYRAMKKSEAPL
ncbi:MAG: ATP-binding protein [Tannerellaceae bacterium]|nr:ATP-binding protein [Tannerellaceae bacterium]